MVNLIHTSYVNLRIDDPRYDNPKNVRADVLKALALISATHRELHGSKYPEPSVTVYKDRKKVTIKYRWPQNWNGRDTIYGILRKDAIYKDVLQMVNDER